MAQNQSGRNSKDAIFSAGRLYLIDHINFSWIDYEKNEFQITYFHSIHRLYYTLTDVIKDVEI